MKWAEWEEYNRSKDWTDNIERGLLKAEYIGSHKDSFYLRLWFEEDLDVSIYDLDISDLFFYDNPGGVYEILKDSQCFQAPEGKYSLNFRDPDDWDNDSKIINIAPECIRFFCEKYGTKIK